MNQDDETRPDADTDESGDAEGGDTEKIRSDIERTRAEMSETIDAIQERLNPDHLKNQVKEQIREQYEEAKEAVREATVGRFQDMAQRVSEAVDVTRQTVMETVRANPVPAILVGVGIGWMLYEARSSARPDRSRGSRERGRGSDVQFYESHETGGRRASGKADVGLLSRAQDATGRVADSVTETVSGAVSQAQETAGQIAGQVQERARRAGDTVQGAMRENPLAVGAVALALGAAVGLAIPQTRRENELMGEARDTLLEQAQSVAQESVEAVKQAAERVVEEVAGQPPSSSPR